MTTPTREQVMQWVSVTIKGWITPDNLHAFATLARADLEATIAEKDAEIERLKAVNVIANSDGWEKTADHWLAKAHEANNEVVELQELVASQQAHIEALREALDEIRRFADSRPVLMGDIADEALAIPSSADALREHDAKLVERIAYTHFAQAAYAHLMSIADKIRKGEWK